MNFARLAFLAACLVPVLSGAEWSVARVVSLEYPTLAPEARMQGEIVVECALDASGQVTASKVIGAGEGLTGQERAILGKAAMDNVRQWRFRWTGAPSPTGVAHIIYKFKLEDKPSPRRTTRFEFEFPNVVFVTSQYVDAMY